MIPRLHNDLLIESIEFTLNLNHGFTFSTLFAINEEGSSCSIATYNDSSPWDYVEK